MPPPTPLLLLLLLVLVGAWAGSARAAPALVLSLDGDQWTVRNDKYGPLPARVPGGVYTDLRAAGVLTSDFFVDDNDESFRWVSYDAWTYERTFEVAEEVLARRHVQLLLHGVDTAAEVRLNGQLLGATDNMFVRYAFDAHAALRAGNNTLQLLIASAPVEARRRFELHQSQRGYPVLPECVPGEYHGECHANHLRKMQASFSWDFGPAFPSSGIWKSVALEAFDGALVRAVLPRFLAREGVTPARLLVRTYLEAGAGAAAVEGSLFVAVGGLPQGALNSTAAAACTPDAAGHCFVDVTLTFAQEPPLWWPNGEGEQWLFPLEVRFTSAAGETSQLERRVGFRTIQLVQEPVVDGDAAKGLTFYFTVNGRAIFAKGTNWIPANVLPELGQNETTVRRLLEAAAGAHMNMLRVWGGGVYESDVFYEIADEVGLLVWQDMMFACAMYPADDAFLASVRAEVQQQVLRLAAHPSVAVWAGNNENEGALVDNWYGTSSNFSVYRGDYVKLYGETIRPLVLELDPTRPFVTSSPSNGLQSDEHGFVSDQPSDPLFGDVHYYNYLSDGWNPDTYPVPRFASEYGFQSLPAWQTLQEAASQPEELAVASPLLRSRQHHPGGYEEMSALVALRMALPANWDRPEGLELFAFMSEVHQAVAIQTETEHYRRLRSQLRPDGSGRCMGALYWQLNDMWACPSWASIDSAGRWKPLMHLAEAFFAPVMASAYVDTAHRLHVWGLNDRQEALLSVVLQARAGRWDSFMPQQWANITEPVTLAAAGSQQLLQEGVAAVLGRLEGCGTEPARCFLLLRLVALPDGEQVGPLREVLPVPPKEAVGMLDPKLTVANVSVSLEVTLTADAPAPFVWLSAGTLEGHFSRNAFLMADAEAKVRFVPAPGAVAPTADQLRAAVAVRSLPPPASETQRGHPYQSGLPHVVMANAAGRFHGAETETLR